MTTDAELLVRVRKMVELQAADEGLWFVAVTAPEAYLQQELRRLHAVVEGDADMEEVVEYEADLNDILGIV